MKILVISWKLYYLLKKCLLFKFEKESTNLFRIDQNIYTLFMTFNPAVACRFTSDSVTSIAIFYADD